MTGTGTIAVELHRTIDAPRDEVFRALVEPELLRRWFFPDSFVVTDVDVDARVGGEHRTRIVSRDHGNHAFDARIRELVPGERIVFDWVFENLDLPARTEQSLLTIELRDNAAGTTDLTLTHARLLETDVHGRENVTEGWSQALDHLVALFERSRP